MDLTYMPGELDYKNKTKVDGSGFDMKREHDSVDDFEHLDPESSPVDTQQKDFVPLENVDPKPDNLSEKSSTKDHNLPDPLITGFSNENLDALSKPTETTDNTISSSKDLLADFETELQHIKNSDILSNPDFDSGKSAYKQDQDDSFNASFIAAEKERVETEDDSGLLGLGSKNKDNVSEPLAVNNFKETINGKESSNEGLDYENPKSMKEADALSQYEMKIERKESTKKDDPIELGKHNLEPLSNDEKPELEPFTKTDPKLIKPEPVITKSEPELPKREQDFQETESVVSEPEIVVPKPESEIPVPKSEPTKEKENIASEKEEPTKPFIAICPSKPSTPAKETIQKPSVTDLDDIIGPEDVFKRIGLDAWFTPERLHPIVEALVYWRDPKKSGVVFGGIMAILLSLCYMSLISVVAYSSLLVLIGTICFRIYKNILQAVQKTSEGHPFKEFLDLELSLPQDKVREMVDTAVVHVNAAIVELRRLFLVEDLIDSIKFGVCLWCLTYVGAIFNGMTLVILAFVALFTVPKIYENNKASIDTYIEMGRSRVAEITSKVKAAVPIGKKEPEKDKEQ